MLKLCPHQEIRYMNPKMIQELFGCENPNDEEMTSLDEAGHVVVTALKLLCINEFKIYLDFAKLL